MIDLSDQQRAIVAGILAEYLPPGTPVWVFGSRATGKARRYSDLDLALEGEAEMSIDDLGALKDALSDSDLPFTVDLVDLRVADPVFRARIAPEMMAFPA